MTEGRAIFLKVFEGLFKCGALFVFFFLLNGCAGLSGTEKHYEHLNGSLSVFDDPTLIQWNKDPKLIVTDDMLAESDALVKKGSGDQAISGHMGSRRLSLKKRVWWAPKLLSINRHSMTGLKRRW
jgi:hypothetical protein